MPSSLASLLTRIQQEAARGGMDIDEEIYHKVGRDSTEPVLLGSGSLKARLGIFGRDPGRTEVELGEPFIGKGGQLVRAGLSRACGGGSSLDLRESIEVGTHVFWGNTVPYKPVGNKAWSVAVKRRFTAAIREFLVEHWEGSELLTLGNVAFDWFRLADPDLKPALKAFWTREDRYESSLDIRLDGKHIRLHPLPHPSPLNARWYPLFPALLDARLRALDWRGA
jgi:uracil-DNA glycosylase